MTDIPEDRRPARLMELRTANTELAQELARRNLQVSPVSVIDAKLHALCQMLAQRLGPDLLMDIDIRMLEMLNEGYQNTLAQTSPLQVAKDVPKWPGLS